ncbi:hypothetical protein M758_10G164100 [Ceratodon purpureus]|nr:hypothetical protein M758_10G164100 [Ceratodon purpureus]
MTLNDLRSCDDNLGPRHITFDNQTVDTEDDMTMDSQTLHTRIPLLKQRLSRLSEATMTPGMLSDMESIHGQHMEKFQEWHKKEAGQGSRVSRQVQPEESI